MSKSYPFLGLDVFQRMSASVPLTHLRCLRCQHRWVPRGGTVTICPRCKSHYWDEPRAREKAALPISAVRPALGGGRGLIKKKRKAILQIAAAHGARRISLFGSVVRGEDRPDSDIDFLVEMEPGRSLLDRAGLLVDLRELLGRPVDVVTARSIYLPIRERVLSEAEPV